MNDTPLATCVCHTDVYRNSPRVVAVSNLKPTDIIIIVISRHILKMAPARCTQRKCKYQQFWWRWNKAYWNIGVKVKRSLEPRPNQWALPFATLAAMATSWPHNLITAAAVDEEIYDDVNDIICAIIDDRLSPIYIQGVLLAIQLLVDFIHATRLWAAHA